MLAKRIIPCLDVDKGRVVKGVKFVSLRDAGDPVAAARAYNDAGADELVFLDITASHERRPIILDVVEKTAAVAFMPLTVGGGIRAVEDIRALLNAGRSTALVLMDTLSAPAFRRARMSSTVRMPPPTVSGMNATAAVLATTSRMIGRCS